MILFALTILSLIPFWQWFSPQIPLTHDILSHIYRLANFSPSLFQGNLIPRWAGNLNLGYGHPVLMFLYPLSGYLGSIFTIFKLSFLNSVKLTFFITAPLSAWGMYLLIKQFTQNKKAAFLASLFYIFAPYHLVNLNVRAAIGEVLALAVFPWLFLAIKRQKICLIAVLTALLILAHNATAILGFIFLGFYLVAKLKQPKFISQTIFALALGLGLSAFFWLPALVEGKYTLRQQLTNTATYVSNYPTFQELIYSPWGFGLSSHQGQAAGFSLQIGYLHWIAALIATIFCFRKTKHRSLLIAASASFWLSLFLMQPISRPLIDKLPLVKNFQFPWRFLNLVVIATSIQAGILAVYLNKKQIFFISIILVILSLPGWRIKGHYQLPTDNQAFAQLPDYSPALEFTTPTTDTGESSPIWSIRWQEQWPKGRVEVIDGEAEVEINTWEFEYHRYQVNARTKTRILDNTLYFPGWKIFIDQQELPLEAVYFQDPNHRGLINFPVPAGDHQIEVKFSNTRLRQISEIISLTTIILILSLFIFRRKIKFI